MKFEVVKPNSPLPVGTKIEADEIPAHLVGKVRAIEEPDFEVQTPERKSRKKAE